MICLTWGKSLLHWTGPFHYRNSYSFIVENFVVFKNFLFLFLKILLDTGATFVLNCQRVSTFMRESISQWGWSCCNPFPPALNLVRIRGMYMCAPAMLLKLLDARMPTVVGHVGSGLLCTTLNCCALGSLDPPDWISICLVLHLLFPIYLLLIFHYLAHSNFIFHCFKMP